MDYPFHEEYETAKMSEIYQDEEIINRLLTWYKDPKYIFLFTGNVGTGKTYFAAAMYNHWIEEKKNVRAFTEDNFLSHLKVGFKENMDAGHEIKRLCECDIFILDDLGHCRMNDWQKEIMFNLIDIRASMKRPTLITSNLMKSDFKEVFGDRMTSRLFASRNTIIINQGEDRRQMEFEIKKLS